MEPELERARRARGADPVSPASPRAHRLLVGALDLTDVALVRPAALQRTLVLSSGPNTLAGTMSLVQPQPNPETVEAIHDIVWRVASVETARTDGLDRKAATLATFASLLTSLTATLGFRFVGAVSQWWAFVLFAAALTVLAASVGMAVRALLPKEYVSLGMEYLERLPTWSEILKRPEEVRGETIQGVIVSVAQERRTNDGKVADVRRAFQLLLVGLVLITAEAITLAAREVF